MSSSTNTPITPSHPPAITLREVTPHNWRLVSKLRVHRLQQGNIPLNPICMLEANYAQNTYLRAIYADEEVVGLLVLATFPPDPVNGYYIYRFMIDKDQQGLGLGEKAMELAVKGVKEAYPAAKVLRVMSAPREVSGESPFGFFEKMGFKEVSQTVEEGKIMTLMETEL